MNEGWLASLKPEGGASSPLSKYFSSESQVMLSIPSWVTRAVGQTVVTQGPSFLGETRSLWSVSAHRGQAQGSFSMYQPPGRISALIPSGTERAGACLWAHIVASSPSPHLPGRRTNRPFLQRQRVRFQLRLRPLPVGLGRCQAGRWA